MCVTKLSSTSGKGGFISQPRPICRNTARMGLQYRVLRAAMGRLIPRSVDRNCAGRNANCVKGLSPDKQIISAVAEQVLSSEGNIRPSNGSGTAGVLDHGMYRRLVAERERSAVGRVQRSEPGHVSTPQGLMPEWCITPTAEVRCSHSSDEVR